MRKQIALLALLGTGILPSHAGESATGLFSGNTFTGDTTYDKLWSLFTLYKDESNPVLQEFALQGMGNLQWAQVYESGHQYDGNNFNKGATGQERYLGNSLDIRRLRLGIKSKWFNQFKLEGNLDLDPDFHYHSPDPDFIHGFAKQILDFYITYNASDAFNVMLGKREAKFGREQEISSKEIITFERSNLSNALYPGELTGLWVNGKGIADHWFYEAGIYTNERSDAFTSLSGDNGEVFLAKLGYDYSDAAGMDSAIVGTHVMYNTKPGDKSGNYGSSPKYATSIALYTDMINGRFGLTSEILWANGAVGQADVFGITVMPSYFIADGLQVVGRLQYASSNRANGLSLYGRYEAIGAYQTPVGDNKGDSYVSGYLGLNYYLYAHKLKLMTGIEYSYMNGNGPSGHFDGYTAFSGLRFSF